MPIILPNHKLEEIPLALFFLKLRNGISTENTQLKT